ncbi:DUF1002 domain-containing protein [Bacillus badius]|uniref:Extracellular protein n=1 Tax=Bacillus badius TaxID=1455 RepID=A0ABR5AYI4_BACBA|nr:DUF1002 domain-containing protein [Bacillus badius]KIL75231.1 Extracellular protein [Bacillus badius]KIL79783.1 Extracellular protein [Bacillus badius]KZN98890.1 hypothetical protein A4244_07240 [Bacillus badius]KZR60318.1 hypothetical protein A3781_09070 [Bacillus badius]MED0664813.1 DUF1002 domain-containing protein [Bacillus badius]
MRKIFAWLGVLFLSFATMAQADSAVGDVIVTLGENLSPAQKEQLLAEMDVPNDVTTVTVSNAEEHKYLGEYIPKAQIGSKAISSSKITMKEKGYGINVQTNNISWVSKEMYANALSTAGIKDADIYITAPFEVSGTAALTGLIKAYETSTGEKIPEEQKQVANEEMVTTAKLGDKIGEQQATELIQRIKEEVAKENPQTIQEIKVIINNVSNELNIQLTQDQINQLAALFDKMKNLDINWDQVNQQIDKAKEKWNEFKNSEEGKGILQSILDFLQSIVDWIAGLFK